MSGISIRAGAVIRTLAFIVLALALCGVVFELAGYSALLMLESVVEGAFLRAGGWAQSLRWALPLFITATGVAISFRCGFFNIGAQGQFYVGAICAAFVADIARRRPGRPRAAGDLPRRHGGRCALGALAGLPQAPLGTDEVITTLMGNFIAALVLVYVTSGPLKDPSGTGQQAASPLLPAVYRISDSQGISPAIIGIAAAVALAMWVLVNRTPFGMLASLAGRNPTMVRFQGARLWTLGLSSFLISGGLAGLAGTIELLGPTGRIASGFLPGHGFTAVLIALVANLSVLATAVVSMFFGGLASAALYLPILAGFAGRRHRHLQRLRRALHHCEVGAVGPPPAAARLPT